MSSHTSGHSLKLCTNAPDQKIVTHVCEPTQTLLSLFLQAKVEFTPSQFYVRSFLNCKLYLHSFKIQFLICASLSFNIFATHLFQLSLTTQGKACPKNFSKRLRNVFIKMQKISNCMIWVKK